MIKSPTCIATPAAAPDLIQLRQPHWFGVHYEPAGVFDWSADNHVALSNFAATLGDRRRAGFKMRYLLFLNLNTRQNPDSVLRHVKRIVADPFTTVVFYNADVLGITDSYIALIQWVAKEPWTMECIFPASRSRGLLRARIADPGPQQPRRQPSEAPRLETAYAMLGLPTTSNAHLVRKTYKRMALEKHPDKGGNAEQFHLLQLAYQQIKNSW